MSSEVELRRLAASTYALDEFSDSDVSAMIHSHPSSIRCLTDSRTIGGAFSGGMRLASQSGLRTAMELRGVTGRTNLLCILRGGISFLPIALDGPPTGAVSFIGTDRIEQRVDVDYARFTMVAGQPCVVGDIVATGGTMRTAMELIAAEAAVGSQITELFLIGVVARQGMEVVIDSFRRLQPVMGAKHLTIVALEALFDLPHTPAPELDLGPQDFLRGAGPVSPEFATTWLDTPQCWFERCGVYDGGKRAFEPEAHELELREYWRTLSQFSPREIAELRCGGPDAVASPLQPFGRWAGDVRDPQEAFERFVAGVSWQEFCLAAQDSNDH